MLVNNIYQISKEPRIYIGIGSKNWDKISGTTENKAYLITHPMWHFGLKSVFMFWKWKLDLKKRNVELILLLNTPSELFLSKITGLSGHFVNQNIHVCEHAFNPDSGAKKIYDAVYIAAAKKYKRLYLAKKIKKLFVITYFWPDIRNEKGEWDLHAFEPSIKHAAFNKDRIGRTEINKILNLSHCGLALSKKEGAMLASMEYQLAGLPVVTTHSIGGRDILLDPEHTIWVDSDPEKIAAAVDKFVKSPPDPFEIRNRTLKNIDIHRRRFYNVIEVIFNGNNKTIEPYVDFQKRIWGDANGIEVHSIIQ